MNHFWPVYTYLASWSQCDQTCLKASKLVKTGNAGTNMARISYISPLEYIGPLYGTLGQICTILPQSAIPAITWYLRPRFLTSASIWTKPFILQILHRTWSPLTKWGHTGPVDTVLCSDCLSLASKDIRNQFRFNSWKFTRMSSAASNVAINGNTSLQQDTLYHCWPFLASLHLLGIFIAMWSILPESVEIGQNW